MADQGAQLGARIKALRNEKGLSQAQLAEASGASEEWIRRLERGVKAPSLATLSSVSQALGVSIAALFARRGDGRDRFELLIADAEGLTDDQLGWLEAAARLMARMPR